jgi:alpha-N-arabinofuranosidase
MLYDFGLPNGEGDITPPRVAVVAAKDKAGGLWLKITNVDPDRQVEVEVTIAGIAVKSAHGETTTAPSRGHLWRVAPAAVDATITAGQKPGVEVQEQGTASVPDTVSAPPFSVSIYSYAVR